MTPAVGTASTRLSRRGVIAGSVLGLAANPCAMMRDAIAPSCRMFQASSPLPADLCAAGRGP